MKLLGGRSLWPSFINFIENFSLLISSCRGLFEENGQNIFFKFKDVRRIFLRPREKAQLPFPRFFVCARLLTRFVLFCSAPYISQVNGPVGGTDPIISCCLACLCRSISDSSEQGEKKFFDLLTLGRTFTLKTSPQQRTWRSIKVSVHEESLNSSFSSSFPIIFVSINLKNGKQNTRGARNCGLFPSLSLWIFKWKFHQSIQHTLLYFWSKFYEIITFH